MILAWSPPKICKVLRQGANAVRLYWDHRRINAIGQIQAAKQDQSQVKLQIALANKTPEEIAALQRLASTFVHGDNLAGRVSFAEATEAYKLAQEDLKEKEKKVLEAQAAAASAPSLGLANVILLLGCRFNCFFWKRFLFHINIWVVNEFSGKKSYV